ncbi:tRNA (guanine(37)-N(1))-methyltransferase [Orientia chuto str. Dubai]|uniref:tRNA (guanine-N(1)-)-methyltransferase n=1 Tax=Orientia chuto str. Dubai TaxID=1359168 RepID=A0A0F3MP95_9RICK|nr:tRNA (guanosine(37)-N1)-methyltransferase TrmD [Candidatus Orientia mediorientalis]KJV57277.1 tRNA (guanine(37)-N(1))-methyltransferase [Orientia chuto str. Dubai]
MPNNSLFHINILSLFPEMFPGPLQYSLAGKALKKNIWSYKVINIKDFGITKHKKVDDEPYGGGCGLVMRADVLAKAIDYVLNTYTDLNIQPYLYYMSPRGEIINQNFIKKIIKQKNIIIICGRFEGIDERVIEKYNILEASLGNFILSGGEIAALALLDSCIRLLPGVIANQSTLLEESFNTIEDNMTLLEYPLYTRPSEWCNLKVPDVLLSGNHKQIKEWRLNQSIKITKQRRPHFINK